MKDFDKLKQVLTDSLVRVSEKVANEAEKEEVKQRVTS